MSTSKEFTGLFEKAFEYAIKKHKGQYRKTSNMPYIRHPISVAVNIERIKTSRNLELLLSTSLLHDTVENCKGVTIEEIAKLFGPKVASIVEELTSDKEAIKKMGKTEYLKKKMENMSSYPLRIKLADREHNVQDIHKMNPDFKESYVTETVEIIKHLETCGRKLTNTQKKLIHQIKTALVRQKVVKDTKSLEVTL
jgi:(p)ppGpp synthase/HD superfamily hydrolase